MKLFIEDLQTRKESRGTFVEQEDVAQMFLAELDDTRRALSATATSMTNQETRKSAEQLLPPIRINPPTYSTEALGEEGSFCRPPATTDAHGGEEGRVVKPPFPPDVTSQPPPDVTSHAKAEQGPIHKPPFQPPSVTTHADSEEGRGHKR